MKVATIAAEIVIPSKVVARLDFITFGANDLASAISVRFAIKNAQKHPPARGIQNSGIQADKFTN